MKSKTWERARRIILSSLLRSDLTMTEIQEIGKALVNDSDFSQHLGLLIKDVFMRIDASTYLGHTKHLMPHYERHGGASDKAMLLINKRRIPKREIVPILKALCPEMKNYFRQPKRTVREMVDAFFKGASERSVSEFIHWLDKGISASDPYLRGIMRKR